LLGAVGAAVLLPVSADAATRTVTMGTSGTNAKKLQALGSDVNDFFPHATTIHVGDRVKFTPTGFHTVEFPAKGKDPVAFIIPNGTKVAGMNDEASQPFWFNGLDQFGINPVALAGQFGKKITFSAKKGLQTGLPLAPKNKPVTVKFTKAGSFTYFCTVHPGMQGSVKVVKRGKKVPSAKAHSQKVAAQYKRDLKIAKALPKSNVPAGVVDVGVAGKHGVEYFGMLPAKVTVSPGQSLQFRMTKGTFEDHTATFGPGDPEKEPDSYLGKLASSFEAPVVDARAIYPSEPPSTTGVLTPALHGNGFWNSGVMDIVAGSAPPDSNTVQFGPAPGTYPYYCLIHPFMKGEVVVQ
jgi:plastocyanin